MVSRYLNRQATSDEVDTALKANPSEDLIPPQGVFFVAREDDQISGCVGLRSRPLRTGEVTRLFVTPAARGRGLASRLMHELEMYARDRGLATLRLDTRDDLVEARRLYVRHGYEEVAPFNRGTHSNLWFEKILT
ncbi:MAG: GNAT family N-acetyltransferase [Actinomycetota bacterium]|nr:GNAT family N-acetyltransferase [Actinomycetota bacterium]